MMNLGLDKFTKKDLPNLESKITISKFKSDQCEEENYHRAYYNNPYKRDIERIEKLISLIHEDLEIEDYKDGLVLINKKFVVSLLHNNWRVLNKNTWYKHKDIKHFVRNYIRKDTA
jgi:hypothetical protein